MDEEGVGGKKILRRKSFFDDRRKSLFTKKEKLALNGEEDEDGEVAFRFKNELKSIFLLSLPLRKCCSSKTQNHFQRCRHLLWRVFKIDT